MATTVEQQPLYEINPSTFSWIFVFRNDALVSGSPIPYWNVKFVAGVFISPIYATLGSVGNQVAVTKTIPNNAGVGIFDLSRFFESYTAPQYQNFYSSSRNVKFKTYASTPDYYFPIHTIDNYSQNDNCIRYVKAPVYVEGSAATNLPAQQISGSTSSADAFLTFNGYLQNDFNLTKIGANFGYRYDASYAPLGPSFYGLLSDAPLIQYAFPEDYGVVSFFNQIFSSMTKITGIVITGTFANGTTQTFNVYNTDANGGVTTPQPGAALCQESILFFGIFPNNLRQAHPTFATWLSSGLVHYEFYLINGPAKRDIASRTHRIVMNCEVGRNYIPIRIAWLNTMGGWDYYTFKMKSSQTIKSKRNDWQQQEGSWNKSQYNPYGYKGGKKAYTVNSKKTISVNSDFISEEEAEWFEFLINSPEVYIIKPGTPLGKGQEFDIFEKYVTSVRLLTSSYKRKTVANDNIIQYSFKFEESRTLNTQPV